jgi:hypothetical protein
MTDLPQTTDEGNTGPVASKAAERGVTRAVSGVSIAIIATVLAAGIWAQGLSAIWALATAALPLLAEYWSIALIVLLVGQVVLM